MDKSDKSDKYLKLPCVTWIATGCCVYDQKCKYIHDIRIYSKNKITKRGSTFINFESKNDIFWPPNKDFCMNGLYEPIDINFKNSRTFKTWERFTEDIQFMRENDKI